MNAEDTSWEGVTLHFMRGLPRAGKSTFTKTLVKERGAVVVANDATRLALHNSSFWPEKERDVRVLTVTIARALVHAGHKYIVFDDVYARSQFIDEVIESLVPVGSIASVKILTTLVDTPPEECIRRAIANGQGMGICRGIIRMYNQADWHEFEYEYNAVTNDVKQFLTRGENTND